MPTPKLTLAAFDFNTTDVVCDACGGDDEALAECRHKGRTKFLCENCIEEILASDNPQLHPIKQEMPPTRSEGRTDLPLIAQLHELLNEIEKAEDVVAKLRIDFQNLAAKL